MRQQMRDRHRASFRMRLPNGLHFSSEALLRPPPPRLPSYPAAVEALSGLLCCNSGLGHFADNPGRHTALALHNGGLERVEQLATQFSREVRK